MTDTLSQDILDKLPEDFRVEIAGLSDEAQAQVLEAVQAAADENALDDFDTDKAMSDAVVADEARQEGETARQEQAEAVEDGDFEKGRDLADQNEWAMKEVEDHGGEAEEQIIQAEADQESLDEAQDERDTANENADWANSLEEAGQDGSVYAESAGVHAGNSAEAADDGDQGGTYGAHDHESDNSTGYDDDATE